MSGFTLDSSSKSLIFRWPDKAVLIPSSFPSRTISLSLSSGIKSKRFLPSFTNVSMSHPSQSLSFASFIIKSGSSPPSWMRLSAKSDPISFVFVPCKACFEALRVSRATSYSLTMNPTLTDVASRHPAA